MIYDKKELTASCDKQTKETLFKMQKETLDNFLERNAISQKQYDESLKTLKEKMGL